MKGFKQTILSLAVLSLLGCTSTSDAPEENKVVTFTQAEIDMMIERAKVEERNRIQKELGRQAQQKSVFDEIRNRQKLQQNLTQEDTVTLKPDVKQQVKQVYKIIPSSRTPVVYRKQDGVVYYRCAANSLVATEQSQGVWQYQADKTELSATLCKKSRDKQTMLSLQEKLYELGYLQSETLTKAQLVDGIWGQSTLEAVKKYQVEHGLLYGQMTIETLEHIGVFAPQEATMLGVNSIYHSPAIEGTDTQTAKNVSEEVEELETQKEEGATANIELAQASSGQKANNSVIETTAASVSSASNDQLQNSNQNAQTVSAQKSNRTYKVIEKIVPTDRKPHLYKKVGGASYYRCAANAFVPQRADNGQWEYSDQKELSATLCKMSRDVATMTDLQYVLYEKGFLRDGDTPKSILVDGVWGESTLEALKKYQLEHGLLFGQLTIESLEHLGIFKPAADRLVVKTEQETKKSEPVEIDQTQVSQTVENKAVEEEPVESQPLVESTAEHKEVASINKVVSHAAAHEIPFVPLKIKLADNNFNASTFVPKDSKPEVYAFVNSFKLWRCGARAILPEATENGGIRYGEQKGYRATLCKMNRTKKLMVRLQTALRDKGYLKPLSNDGGVLIDGIWGETTLDAVMAYQKANGLAYGQLTIETLEHLGVFIKE
ncbi:MAG: peptidoglycan-binding domain-containing protein [Thiomicrorhabdus sp.]|nr:peptidoglycan-binding domain-containing protein [Thiomicrorhabdus sp.]